MGRHIFTTENVKGADRFICSMGTSSAAACSTKSASRISKFKCRESPSELLRAHMMRLPAARTSLPSIQPRIQALSVKRVAAFDHYQRIRAFLRGEDSLPYGGNVKDEACACSDAVAKSYFVSRSEQEQYHNKRCDLAFFWSVSQSLKYFDLQGKSKVNPAYLEVTLTDGARDRFLMLAILFKQRCVKPARQAEHYHSCCKIHTVQKRSNTDMDIMLHA